MISDISKNIGIFHTHDARLRHMINSIWTTIRHLPKINF